MKLVSLAIIIAGAAVSLAILVASGRVSLPRPDYEIAVADRLIDPESARFRNIDDRRTEAAGGVCGEMDSRNRMGGYVGWTRFFARKPGGGERWEVYFEDDEVDGDTVLTSCS